MRHGLINLVKIKPMIGGYHVKLVSSRKLDIAPGVREDLGQLGFQRRESHDLLGHPPKEQLGFGLSCLVATGDDLRLLDHLAQGVPLGDSFRAESNTNLLFAGHDELIHLVRGSG